MSRLKEMIKIANIHAERIQWAVGELKAIFPLDKSKVTSFTAAELLFIELLMSRFEKLHYLLGNKLIDAFLEQHEENTQQLTMFDKINKLERLGIIESTELWKAMREVRNHVAHEYPEHPEITAQYLNQLFDLTPGLLNILNKIQQKTT